MDNTTVTIQPAPTCTLDLKFSTKDQLQKAVEEKCSMKYAIQDDRSAVEEFFVSYGGYIGIGLIVVFALLGYFLFLKVKNPKKTSTNDSEESEWMQRLQTPAGMSLALLLGTAVTCLLGIFLVAVYKWLGINDDFGQGSGSLIQAIWGSAATITAAVVAILLALESIKQSTLTNKLQEQSLMLEHEQAEFAKTQSEQYRHAAKVAEYADMARFEIDRHTRTLTLILGPSNGEITPKNIDAYITEVKYFVDAINQKSTLDIQIYILSMPIFNVGNEEKTVSDFFDLMDSIFTAIHKLQMKNDTLGAVLLANNQGRSYWPHLREIANKFEKIDRKELFDEIIQRKPYISQYKTSGESRERLDMLFKIFQNN